MARIFALVECSREPGTLSFADWGKNRVARELDAQIGALGVGSHTGSLDLQLNPQSASGALAIAAGTGAEAAVIGGRTVTVTWAASDANTSDLLAAAINADAVAAKFASAVSRCATATVTIAAGAGTIAIVVTAPAAAVTNQAQAAGNTYSATWATSDTATAAALVALINADGASPVFASSAAGVITLTSRPNGTASGATNTTGNLITLAATGTGVTKSGALLSGGGTNANTVVQAIVPGTVGLGITLTATGTGNSVVSGGNLVGGVGAPGNSFTC